MNQRKELLENKIALAKELRDRWSKKLDTLKKEQIIIEEYLNNCEEDVRKNQKALNELLSEETEEIAHTLGRYGVEKTNPVWKEITASLIFILLLSVCKAQPFVGMEAGNRMGINAGMIYKNIEVKGGALIPYTRRADISNVTYAQLGYKIGNAINVTPLVGVAHYHVSKFEKNLNERVIVKNVFSKSLEIGHDFTTRSNHYGNYYLFISQAQEVYAGAGLKIYVK